MNNDNYKAISEAVKEAIRNPCSFVQSYWIDFKKYLETQFKVVK
jgi:hypothetical protein